MFAPRAMFCCLPRATPRRDLAPCAARGVPCSARLSMPLERYYGHEDAPFRAKASQRAINATVRSGRQPPR